MKKARLTLDKLKKILQKEKEFQNIADWNFEHIDIGEMQHKYRVSSGKKVYFVKEMACKEKEVTYFIYKMNLPSLPSTTHPNLLKNGVLVREFLNGRSIKSKKLDLELVRDFAIFQNKMDDKNFFKENNIFHLNGVSYNNNSPFFRKGFVRNFNYSFRRINQLNKIYGGLEIIKKYESLLYFLKKDIKNILNDYLSMPFAGMHNDFREDNIIQTKKGQKLIDWGSCYCYGFFMKDICIFLANDKSALKNYIKYSNICKKATKEQIQRWIYVSLVERLLGVLRWMANPKHERCNNREKCKNFLEYEYQTYKYLLKKKSAP